jgi:hypothetical protein
LTEIDFASLVNSWPAYLIVAAMILVNFPKIMQGLALLFKVVIPPFGTYIERRAEVEAMRVSANTWDKQADERFANRMLNIIEESMKQTGKLQNLQSETHEALIELRFAIERHSKVVTGMNMTLTRLSDNVGSLGEKINSLKWLLINKSNGDAISVMASLEEDEKLGR